jgi:hypothetical protein
MDKAYYVLTDIGPYKAYQVVVLPEWDGWVRSGWLRELKTPVPPKEPTREG